jgi:hypothetical protein
MFKNRINSGPFLIRDVKGNSNNSFTPQNGDVATVVVDENNIQIQVELATKNDENWTGTVVSYNPEIKGETPAIRFEEIKKQEEFVNDNHLTYGSELSFVEGKIFCLSR